MNFLLSKPIELTYLSISNGSSIKLFTLRIVRYYLTVDSLISYYFYIIVVCLFAPQHLRLYFSKQWISYRIIRTAAYRLISKYSVSNLINVFPLLIFASLPHLFHLFSIILRYLIYSYIPIHISYFFIPTIVFFIALHNIYVYSIFRIIFSIR